MEVDDAQNDHSSYECSLEGSPVCETVITYASAHLSSISVPSEPISARNSVKQLPDVSDGIIASLSNSELSASGNIENAASIIITNDTMVFPLAADVKGGGMETDDTQNDHSSSECTLECSMVSETVIGDASVNISSVSVPSEPIFTSNSAKQLSDASDGIINSLSNSELSASAKNENPASIIIPDDAIVFPPAGPVKKGSGVETDNPQNGHSSSECLLEGSTASETLITDASVQISSASLPSEPIFTSNSEKQLSDASDRIITSLSNSELSASGNIENPSSIIITNDTIVFPPGTLMLSGESNAGNTSQSDEMTEDLDDESGNENSEFDIKVESNALKSNITSFKVEANQSDHTSSSYTLNHSVLQNIADPESDLQQISFSNGDHITQFHIQMPLSISDIQNLQKINRNVFMSQAALPEDNKTLDGGNIMIDQDGKHEYLASSPPMENDGESKCVVRDNDRKEYLSPDGTFNADQHGNLFIKNENINTPGNVIQAEEIVEGNIKCENTINNPTESQLVSNLPYQQIMYVQVDATDPNGHSQLLPINVSEGINEGTLEIVSKPVDTLSNGHNEKKRKGRKPRTKKIDSEIGEKSSLRTLAPRLLSFPLYAGAQAGIGIGKNLLKPFNLGDLQIVEGGQYFEVLGRCTQCFRFSRTTAYCRAEKNHRDPKSSVCMECEAVGLSTVVCRRKLNHSAPNAQPLNIVINTALQNDDHVKQLCMRNHLPACFSELQSIVVHHADITFVGQRTKVDDREFGNNDLMSTPQVTRKPTEYARGYLYPYSKEKWTQWLLKFCYQTQTNFRIRTGKRVNKKLDHGLANHNGKIVPYRTLETQLYNCALGGRPRKRKIRDGIKKRKERGSKLIGCPAVIHTRLLETEYKWCALEVTVPKILAHIPFHDPRENPTSVLLVECNDVSLSQNNILHSPGHVEEIVDEEQKFDFIHEVGDENEDLNHKKECSLDVRKNTKSILLTCASLTEMIDNHSFMLSIQEQARDLLNKMHKEAISTKQNMAKKAKRKKYLAEQESGEFLLL